MTPLAHIAGIPVQESLPFLVPVLGLAYWVRREDRKRRRSLARIAESGTWLDQGTVDEILASWAASGHVGLSREHVPLLSPPGVEGVSTAQLAARTHSNPGAVEPLLDQLAALGYLDLDEAEGRDRRAWLTSEGYSLLHAAEDVILAGTREPAE